MIPPKYSVCTLQLVEISLARAITRALRHHHNDSCSKLNSVAKNPKAHPHQSPVPNLHLPAGLTACILSLFSQPALPDHLAVSPFLDPRSLLISCYLPTTIHHCTTSLE